MKTLDETQVKKMMEDISTIKEVLAKSKPSLQLLFLPVHFRMMSLLLGIIIILLAGAYHLLMVTFGSYENIPELYRYLFYGAIIISWFSLGIMKIRNWSSSISKMDPRFSIKKIYKEIITFRTVHSYLIFFITISFFTVYWLLTGQASLIIPTLSLGMGILLNIIGNMTEIKQYIVSGCWMMIWGFLFILLPAIPGPIVILFSFGVGFILSPIYSYIYEFPKEK